MKEKLFGQDKRGDVSKMVGFVSLAGSRREAKRKFMG